MRDATGLGRLVFLDGTDRVRLEVGGPDRAKFLNNLTTNEVKKLATGQGVEAFVTSPQGKTLGYVTLLAGESAILVRTDSGGAELMLPHLRKYGIFDDVTIDDMGGSTFEFHMAGPGAEGVVVEAGGELPTGRELDHRETTVAGAVVRVIRESPLGMGGVTIVGKAEDAAGVRGAILGAQGVEVLEPTEAEALRIEAGTPAFGKDVAAENLPQEVARDRRAINFVKGCYLGQETVARIDALGHVNKTLRGLTMAGGPADAPAKGAVLEGGGKAVGTITSAAYSGRLGCVVALGYLKTSHEKAGTTLEVVEEGRRRGATVVDLPMAPK